MRHTTIGLASLFALSACHSDPTPKPSADTVFANARIWTGDPDQPWAESLAVSGNRIVALGTTETISSWRGAETELHDLDGHLVLPGFQDSHTHLSYTKSVQVDLAGAETLSEIQDRIETFAAANPDLPWVVGFGWGYGAFPDQRPLAEHLDAVTSSRPAFITSRDGHMGLANMAALRLAGIDADTPDPDNGRIVRGENGQPTGELQERAMDMVRALIPDASEDQRYALLLGKMRQAASHGITAIHEAGVDPNTIALFERADADGALLQRVDIALRMVTPDTRNSIDVEAIRTHLTDAAALRDRAESPLIRLRSVKGMLDGTIDATTAAMFNDYVGTNTSGLPFWEPGPLGDAVALYDAAGYQILLHAIGDRAIADALDAFQHARQVNGPRDSRHRVEHAEMPRLSDLARFRDLSVTASTQPMFAYPDATVLENFAPLLGHDRAQHADNFAVWDEAGVRQVFGSDHPVMTQSVLAGIETAVTRTTEAGLPPGGWYPDGRIGVEAAIRHYTTDSAWAVHDEDTRGTLAVGTLADFVVLSENILGIEPASISETRVLRTVMGGRTTYLAER